MSGAARLGALLLGLVIAGGGEVFAATIGLNFTGTSLPDSGFFPPDAGGAVGPSHIVELINGRYRVYDKTNGSPVRESSLNAFWSDAGVSVTNFAFNPRAVYDHASGRWFAASVDNAGAANSFLVAVSGSSDPTGPWVGFKIDSDAANTRWADFPTLGVDADGVYLAANMFDIPGGTTSPRDVTIVSIPKADLLLATPTVAGKTSFEIAGISARGFTPQPVVDYGPSDGRGAILAVDAELFSVLNRTNVLGAGGAGAVLSSSTNLPVAATSYAPDADQPGMAQNLDTGDDRFSGAVFEVGDSLWAVHSISTAGRAAIRWYEIDETTSATLQYGTIGDASHDYFYPSITANAFGDVVIGFGRSSESEFASSYAVVGATEGEVTTFGLPMLLMAGVAEYEVLSGGLNRWGNYSATALDPSDPLSFWTFQEFASAEDVWSVQITQIVVPEPNTLAMLFVGSMLTLLAKRRSPA